MADPKATIFKPGEYIDHTPSADVTGGTPIQVAGGIIGIAVNDIDYDNSETDGLLIKGIIKIEHTASIGNIGDNVWWDADGSPYGGTASSGAATTVASAGDFWLGTLAESTTATSSHCYVILNKVNPDLPHWPNRLHQLNSGNLTIDDLDSGKVIHTLTDADTFTLPADTSGIDLIIQNDAANGDAMIELLGAAADEIQGQDIDGTAATALLNTKTTAIRGDYLWVIGGTATYTMIKEKRGIWAEA